MSSLQLNGLKFRVEIVHDDDATAPWDREDGHGIVTNWVAVPKKPGERVLVQDKSMFRYYNFSETVKISLRDAWGVKDSRGKTKSQIAAEAAADDYRRLGAWCNNEWHYIGVVVTLLDVDGHPTRRSASLWGIESDADGYLDEVAKELAEELEATLKGSNTVCQVVRVTA